MIPELVGGSLFAVAVLAFVLYPVFFPPRTHRRPQVIRATGANEPRVAASIVALREVEFDRATGKLSDDDYNMLKARYMADAVTEMRDRTASGASSADPVDVALAAYRAEHPPCPNCGPRPESDAVYCSNCGTYLAERCEGCDAPVTVAGARFCPDCGRRLAA